MATTLFEGTSVDRQNMLYVGSQIDRPTIARAMFAAALVQRDALGHDPVALFGQVLLAHAGVSPAQLFQDLFALFVNDFKRGGIFVEVGTGDGRTISNTYLLEKAYDWTGLVVEANPAFLPALREQRGCAIATDCVFDVSGQEVRFMCQIDPEFSGIASDEFGQVKDEDMHSTKRTGGVTELTLKTTSLNDLLIRESLLSKIDFLSVDVEGAEFCILRTFDFDRWRPRCVTVEHNWQRSRAHIAELLQQNGYVRVFEEMSQWDDWYVDRAYLEVRPEWSALLAAQQHPTAGDVARALLEGAINAIERDALIVAESLCRAALERDPQISTIHRTLADIAERAGHPTEAAKWWREAIAVNAQEYWARIGLAELLRSRGETDEAVQLLKAAVELATIEGDQNASEIAKALLLKVSD